MEYIYSLVISTIEINTIKKVAELIINNEGGYVSAKTLDVLLPFDVLLGPNVRKRAVAYINKFESAFSFYSIKTSEYDVLYKSKQIIFL